MKYQITCDNCGTQFIVEAEEGQTIECNCPHCHGLMEITLPLVSAGQQYEQPVSYGQQIQQPQETMPKKSSHEVIVWEFIIVSIAMPSVWRYGISSCLIRHTM